MHHMRKATVRDLRYHFPDVETQLQEGEEIQITKHKRVIARLIPERAASAPHLPAFAARLAKIYGKKKLAVTGSELIRAERDGGN